MSKVAVIGREDLIVFFKIFGFRLFFIDKKEELSIKIEEAIKEGNKLIFVEESLIDKDVLLKDYQKEPFPLIIPLSIGKSLGLIKDILSEASLKAFGKSLS